MFKKKTASINAQRLENGDVVCSVIGRGDHVVHMTGEIIGNVAQTMLETDMPEEKVRSILHRVTDIAINEAKKAVEDRRKAGETNEAGTEEDPRT